ncbi:MAG TPA: amidohydrolase [Vicinamibacterales bacterium]|jgi:5-methylthioadenosine/S-adenosylhomocysteine deaminase|nr:amidohydrolase [Vicinamibacterales bacterium]
MLRQLGLSAAVCLAVFGYQVAQQQTVSLVVTNGIVVTVDSARRVIPRGAVAIDGRDIVAVDAADVVAARFRGRDSIDAGGAVVMPGLINTHTHAPMVLFRGLADDLALMDWLQKYIFPAEAKTVSPEFVRAGTRLAALEMIESGTTAYADMYYFEEEIGRATRAAGLRGVLGQTIIQFPVPDARTPGEGLARTERFAKEFAGDDLITPAVAPHAMYTNDPDTLKACRALADRLHIPLITHLAETQDEVKTAAEKYHATPTAFLDSLGFFGPRTLVAHAVHLTADDIRILASRHVGVSHNPESNMKLASGIAPVEAMRKAGVTVGLGTDGAASNNDLDMFEAMRQAAFLHKLVAGDPRAIPAPVAVEMATIDGARALGLEKEIGSLERGKRADLIVVSMSSARQTPMYDPVSHLVYVTRGDDVTTTIVNGKILMRNRQVLTVDRRQVLADARAFADKVRAAVK